MTTENQTQPTDPASQAQRGLNLVMLEEAWNAFVDSNCYEADFIGQEIEERLFEDPEGIHLDVEDFLFIFRLATRALKLEASLPELLDEAKREASHAVLSGMVERLGLDGMQKDDKESLESVLFRYAEEHDALRAENAELRKVALDEDQACGCRVCVPCFKRAIEDRDPQGEEYTTVPASLWGSITKRAEQARAAENELEAVRIELATLKADLPGEDDPWLSFEESPECSTFKDPYISPGQKLRAARKAKGLSMGDVAKKLGIAPSQVSDVERDLAPFPSGFAGDVWLAQIGLERSPWEQVKEDAEVGHLLRESLELLNGDLELKMCISPPDSGILHVWSNRYAYGSIWTDVLRATLEEDKSDG